MADNCRRLVSILIYLLYNIWGGIRQPALVWAVRNISKCRIQFPHYQLAMKDALQQHKPRA